MHPSSTIIHHCPPIHSATHSSHTSTQSTHPTTVRTSVLYSRYKVYFILHLIIYLSFFFSLPLPRADQSDTPRASSHIFFWSLPLSPLPLFTILLGIPCILIHLHHIVFVSPHLQPTVVSYNHPPQKPEGLRHCLVCTFVFIITNS